MKRVAGILFVAILFVAGFAQATMAQQGGVSEPGVVIQQERVFQTPEGGPASPPHDFVFIATEGFGGKVVKGAPYSGETVTETVQTLGDGNRIVNKITTQVYRDSEGRTRRDQTLTGFGPLGNGEQPLQTIFINDPVSGVTYTLDTRTHIAHKSVPFQFTMGDKPVLQGERFEFKTAAPGNAQGVAATTSSVIVATQTNGAGQAGTRVAPLPDKAEFTMRTEGTARYMFRTKTGGEDNEVTEQLGKQTIEGVEAEGSRTTLTIPAGQIGNDRAIEIVSERWYSPELQLVVMSRHSDPRSGETTFKLTNINRAEPAKSMFEVPAGFTVKEMQLGPPTIAPLPRKKPE